MSLAHQRLAAFAILAGAVCTPSLAAADPAPITYANQSTMTASLTGGGEGSYGYGAPRPARRAAPIDVRRTSSAPQPANAGEGERPDWLERERVGPPYEANGRWYAPAAEPGYEVTGQASWYGPTFHGRPTATGEVFDQEAISAAHPTLPIPSLVQVTNLENGREIIVRVNDRGPFVGDRVIDLSRRAAEVLGFEQAGQARVHLRYLGPAPRHVAGAQAVNAAAQPAPIVSEPVEMAAQDGPISLLPPATPMPAPSPVTVAEAPLPAYQPAAAPMSAPGPGYFVQVGAFADLMNAHRVQAQIASAGPVQVDARDTARGELFRVRVGPLATPEEAEAARRVLANLGYADTILATR